MFLYISARPPLISGSRLLLWWWTASSQSTAVVSLAFSRRTRRPPDPENNRWPNALLTLGSLEAFLKKIMPCTYRCLPTCFASWPYRFAWMGFWADSPVPARRRRWPPAPRRSSHTRLLSSYLKQKTSGQIKGCGVKQMPHTYFNDPFKSDMLPASKYTPCTVRSELFATWI